MMMTARVYFSTFCYGDWFDKGEQIGMEYIFQEISWRIKLKKKIEKGFFYFLREWKSMIETQISYSILSIESIDGNFESL